MTRNMYNEKQSFWTWWLIVLMIFVFYLQVKPFFENNWSVDTANYVGIGIFSTVIIGFILVRLHTKIDEQGITIRFLPFVRKKTWKWEDIEQVYIREYTISDYGGWGYRTGKHGIAYNTKGKKGFQLVLKNGNRVLIGTQNPALVKQILQKHKSTNNENTH